MCKVLAAAQGRDCDTYSTTVLFSSMHSGHVSAAAYIAIIHYRYIARCQNGSRCLCAVCQAVETVKKICIKRPSIVQGHSCPFLRHSVALMCLCYSSLPTLIVVSVTVLCC